MIIQELPGIDAQDFCALGDQTIQQACWCTGTLYYGTPDSILNAQIGQEQQFLFEATDRVRICAWEQFVAEGVTEDPLEDGNKSCYCKPTNTSTWEGWTGSGIQFDPDAVFSYQQSDESQTSLEAISEPNNWLIQYCPTVSPYVNFNKIVAEYILDEFRDTYGLQENENLQMISIKMYFDGDYDTPLCEAHSYLDWHDEDDEIHTYTVTQWLTDGFDTPNRALACYEPLQEEVEFTQAGIIGLYYRTEGNYGLWNCKPSGISMCAGGNNQTNGKIVGLNYVKAQPFIPAVQYMTAYCRVETSVIALWSENTEYNKLVLYDQELSACSGYSISATFSSDPPMSITFDGSTGEVLCTFSNPGQTWWSQIDISLTDSDGHTENDTIYFLFFENGQSAAAKITIVYYQYPEIDSTISLQLSSSGNDQADVKIPLALNTAIYQAPPAYFNNNLVQVDTLNAWTAEYEITITDSSGQNYSISDFGAITIVDTSEDWTLPDSLGLDQTVTLTSEQYIQLSISPSNTSHVGTFTVTVALLESDYNASTSQFYLDISVDCLSYGMQAYSSDTTINLAEGEDQHITIPLLLNEDENGVSWSETEQCSYGSLEVITTEDYFYLDSPGTGSANLQIAPPDSQGNIAVAGPYTYQANVLYDGSVVNENQISLVIQVTYDCGLLFETFTPDTYEMCNDLHSIYQIGLDQAGYNMALSEIFGGHTLESCAELCATTADCNYITFKVNGNCKTGTPQECYDRLISYEAANYERQFYEIRLTTYGKTQTYEIPGLTTDGGACGNIEYAINNGGSDVQSTVLTDNWISGLANEATGSSEATTDIGADLFNSAFQNSFYHIIRYNNHDSGAAQDELYYRRLTDQSTFEPYLAFACNFQNSETGTYGTDYKIYNSLEDAKLDQNDIGSCQSTTQADGKGFPFGCLNTDEYASLAVDGCSTSLNSGGHVQFEIYAPDYVSLSGSTLSISASNSENQNQSLTIDRKFSDASSSPSDWLTYTISQTEINFSKIEKCLEDDVTPIQELTGLPAELKCEVVVQTLELTQNLGDPDFVGTHEFPAHDDGITLYNYFETETLNPSEDSRTYSTVWAQDGYHDQGMLDSIQAWSTSINDVDQWTVIDAGSQRHIQGVVVQSRANYDQWVIQAKFAISDNAQDWIDVQSGQVFDTGITSVSEEKFEIYFETVITARYLKIMPQSWSLHISLRSALIVYGATQETTLSSFAELQETSNTLSYQADAISQIGTYTYQLIRTDQFDTIIQIWNISMNIQVDCTLFEFNEFTIDDTTIAITETFDIQISLLLLQTDSEGVNYSEVCGTANYVSVIFSTDFSLGEETNQVKQYEDLSSSPNLTTITIAPREDYVVDSGPTTFYIERGNDLVGTRQTATFNLLVTVNCIEKFAETNTQNSEDFNSDLNLLDYTQNSQFRLEIFSGYITENNVNWGESPQCSDPSSLEVSEVNDRDISWITTDLTGWNANPIDSTEISEFSNWNYQIQGIYTVEGQTYESEVFEVRLKTDCWDQLFQPIQTCTDLNPCSISILTSYIFDVSTQYQNNKSSKCGQAEVLITSDYNFLSVDFTSATQTTKAVKIYPLNDIDIGIYPFSVTQTTEGIYDWYTEETTQLWVEVTPCQVLEVLVESTLDEQYEYTIFKDIVMSMQMPVYTLVPACLQDLTYNLYVNQAQVQEFFEGAASTLVDTSQALYIDPLGSEQIVYYADNLEELGTKEVYIEAISEDGVINSEARFSLISHNGCEITRFDMNSINLRDMYYLVNETQTIQNFVEVSDVICKFGTECCGSRQYTLLNNENLPFLNFDPSVKQFQVYTQDKEAEGVYTISMQVGMTDYLEIVPKQTVRFDITIYNCKTSSIVPTTYLKDQIYTINLVENINEGLEVILPYLRPDVDCGYPVDYTLEGLKSDIMTWDQTNEKILVNIRDIEDAVKFVGRYPIKYQAKIEIANTEIIGKSEFDIVIQVVLNNDFDITTYAPVANLEDQDKENELEQEVVPDIVMSEVSNVGEINIQFARPVKYFKPEIFGKRLQETKDEGPATPQEEEQDQNCDWLLEAVTEVDGRIRNVLEITYIPQENSKFYEVELEGWNCFDESENGFSIKTNFNKMDYVSSNLDLDLLDIVYWSNIHIQFADTGKLVQDFEIVQPIPKQMSQTQKQIIEPMADSMQDFLTGMLVGNWVVNFLLKASLNQVISIVVKLQFLVHMMLVNFPVPQNVTIMYQALFPIVTFDLIETDMIYGQYIEKMEFQEPLTDRFGLVGYETLYFFPNLGFLSFMFLVMFIIFAVTYFGRKIKSQSKFGLWVRNKSEENFRSIHWNGFIAIIYDSYIVICMCAGINFYMPRYPENSFEWINYGAAWVFSLFFMIIFPLWMFIFYCKNFDKVNDKEFAQKYDMIYQNLNLKRGPNIIWHPFIKLINELILCIYMIYLRDKPIYQISLNFFTTIIVTNIFGLIKPFKDKRDRQMEYLNQFIALITCYHILCFTEYVLSEENKQKLGISLICVTMTMILINLMPVFLVQVYHCKLKCKKCNKRRHHLEAMRQKKLEAMPYFSGIYNRPDKDKILKQQTEKLALQKELSKQQSIQNDLQIESVRSELLAQPVQTIPQKIKKKPITQKVRIQQYSGYTQKQLSELSMRKENIVEKPKKEDSPRTTMRKYLQRDIDALDALDVTNREQEQQQQVLLENSVGEPGDARDLDLIAKENKFFSVQLDQKKAKQTYIDDSEEDISSVDSLPQMLTQEQNELYKSTWKARRKGDIQETVDEVVIKQFQEDVQRFGNQNVGIHRVISELKESRRKKYQSRVEKSTDALAVQCKNLVKPVTDIVVQRRFEQSTNKDRIIEFCVPVKGYEGQTARRQRVLTIKKPLGNGVEVSDFAFTRFK